MQIRISVRNLVEFILRSGDIDNRKSGASDNAMQEGSRIHRLIQKQMGEEYQPEYFLRYTWETENYCIVVEGRADGLITAYDGSITIDEIKTTWKEVSTIKAPVAVHLAQAKVYAAIFALQNQEMFMHVRMTYCNVETEEIRYFHESYTLEELKEWFFGVLEQYKKCADYEWEWKQKRKESIEKLQFPFAYRDGQKELAGAVYRTIYHKRKLFIEAPTGVGKTISTVFPAVKAIGAGLADKIFYLTAKTITRTVAENTFRILRNSGLQFKSVILTAKEKICFMEEAECNPEYCPFAKGHFDRINDAVYALLREEESFTREVLERYARKYQVCPFEFCLDVSLFADAVIGDYNYVFDPHVYLKRFFGESGKGEYIFLVDEAHNLLERGREMYSAALCKETFLKLKKEITHAQEKAGLPAREKGAYGHLGRIRDFAPKLTKLLDKCNKVLLAYKRECEDYRVLESVDALMSPLMRLHEKMDEYLDEQDDTPVRTEILDFFFEISHFLDIYERVDDNYVMYSWMTEEGEFFIKLFCVNPAINLQECMERSRSTVLFSATLLPIQYYKKLLGGTEKDYEVYAKSVFRPEKRALYISKDVTSRYTRRSENEFYNIARYLYEIINKRHGNYMVFFLSHAFLKEVYDCFFQYFADEETECIVQEGYMDETAREAFIARFEGNEACDFSRIQMEVEIESNDKKLVGFCVLGGIFGEGIDLKHDSLIGVIVVGTGLPQVCVERELLKQYFEERGEIGFDYAYRFPGMNKVLQAAGRVIRTAEDVGIIALLDERFLQYTYQKLFPREWSNYEVVTLDTVAGRVERFWDEWL